MTDDPTRRSTERRVDEPPARARRCPLDVARRLEAILLVVDEPQSLVSLAAAVGAPVPAVRQAIEALVADYDGEPADRGAASSCARSAAAGASTCARSTTTSSPSSSTRRRPSRLSQAALETLAVIAYKQPVTRGQVASIRAVNVDSVVRTLLARGLITELFTDAETGAINYGTTDALLVQPRHQLARRAAAHLAAARRRRDGFDRSRRIRRRGRGDDRRRTDATEGVRLQKVLANAGVASRRVAEQYRRGPRARQRRGRRPSSARASTPRPTSSTSTARPSSSTRPSATSC